jgi:hypothetical protein
MQLIAEVSNNFKIIAAICIIIRALTLKRVTSRYLRRINCNARHQTYFSTVKATFAFSGRYTTGCRSHGGRIRVVCHGESHPKITELRRYVLQIMS